MYLLYDIQLFNLIPVSKKFLIHAFVSTLPTLVCLMYNVDQSIR